MWTKIKEFFAWLWEKIKLAWRWILGGLVALALIIIAVIAVNPENSNDTDNTSRPEIAQVFEPSIGTPLPPDGAGGEGEVDGAQTTEPQTSTPTPTTVAFVSPPTGVNDNIPFTYKSEQFGFSVNLEGGTQVDEQTEGVRFSTKSGTVLMSVIVTTTDTPANIAAQLKQSVGVSNISETKFGNYPAVSFASNGQSGVVIVTTDKAYYLTGNKAFFSRFSI